jgi:putative ABC transport system permease protein
MPRKVPLAWSNLKHNPVKLAGSLAGITFAVALMFMELGFQNALLDSMVGLLETFDADLVLLSSSNFSMGFQDPFSRRNLQRAQQCEGVAAVSPIYIETTTSMWRVGGPAGGVDLRPIRVVGFRVGDPVFADPVLAAQAERLRAPDTALFDRRGKVATYGRPRVGEVAKLSDRPIRVVGEFGLGADFLNDGNLLMGDRTFQRFFPARRFAGPDLLLVDLGLIKLRPGVDAAAARQRVAAALPEGVEVLTRAQAIARERRFWLTSTPVGFVFRLGLVMGFVVGTIICYQILYSDITSYLREYATLMAMGYRRGYLVRVVVLEALYLGLLGFGLGILVAAGLYAAAQGVTKMPFLLGADRIAWIFAATLGMCLLSAILAIRKLWSAAPAELF